MSLSSDLLSRSRSSSVLLIVIVFLCLSHHSNAQTNGGWSAWSDCDRECGAGQMTRVCNSPVPSGGGVWCNQTSDNLSSRVCNTSPCPFVQLAAGETAAVAVLIVILILSLIGVFLCRWWRQRRSANRAVIELSKANYKEAHHDATHYDTSGGRKAMQGASSGEGGLTAAQQTAQSGATATHTADGTPLPLNYPWTKQFDSHHARHYWFNGETGESLWLPPPGWVEPDQ